MILHRTYNQVIQWLEVVFVVINGTGKDRIGKNGRSKKRTRKDRLCAFWDFLLLFSGISTASNLTRTRGRTVLNRGLFLFRKR